MDELEEIRRRKLMELQAQRQRELEELQRQQELQRQVEMQKKAILRAILEPEARERLSRVKLAHPEVAEAVENQLIFLAQSGRITTKISDEMLKEILKRAMPKKREPKIIRK
ncbi:DNA-binding protein [Archaeoglobus veneficus]|uniref:DNA-binding protein Arcve_1761 n=1 Tax=Archaeoglobus veneficus (strain DSM 11195 / SNP6) TaxID=693661 RepID=F2KQV2_ARCVS|nr:DNA-binding protein [Archaeoglobus veneficus]AEA47758.1 DNA-binding protein [Archaeoglobus veneficus SNP6]